MSVQDAQVTEFDVPKCPNVNSDCALDRLSTPLLVGICMGENDHMAATNTRHLHHIWHIHDA